MKDAASRTSVSISTLTRVRSRSRLSRTATQTSIMSGRNCFEVNDLNMAESRDCRRVKVLYTGGTIGMVRNNQGVLAPIPHEFEQKLRQNPQMHDKEYSKHLFGLSSEMAPLVLPDVPGMKRIVYCIYEYENLLDSSNMTMDDWSRIGNDIRQIYELFDGFVILHGTDTLPYTASALSFMLENLGKTVIITGSQIPIFEVRSDGVDNLLSSLILAGNYVIPEVTVYFNYKLFRGNRTVKISSGSFKAFDSPNFPPLGKIGLKVEVQYREIFRPTTLEKFKVHSNLNKNVGLLRIFPSISTSSVEAFLQSPMEGVVLQTYGAGNIPSNRDDLTEVFRKATERGVIIINCTQCSKGTVSELYQTGKDLYDTGVLPGFDMTPEAALAKLAYVLSKDEWDKDYKRSIMQSNIRGELTGVKSGFQQEFDLVDAIAKSLLITCHEFGEMDTVLFPAMLCSAVDEGDTTKIAELKRYGANMSATNPDLRTPLHIACANGDLEIVQYLLLSGASIHMRDRYDQTPLLDAIQGGHEPVIKLLRQCGAHLHLSPTQIGEKLCSAASHGDDGLLNSFLIGGANLSQTDNTGRTALHAAVISNEKDTVEYLLSKKVTTDLPDILGFTPLDLAKRLGLDPIIELLKGTEGPESPKTVTKEINGVATLNEES